MVYNAMVELHVHEEQYVPASGSKAAQFPGDLYAGLLVARFWC